MPKLRISLRGMLIAVTVAAIYLGARQWRLQAVDALGDRIKGDPRTSGYLCELPNDWQDVLWQRKPTVAKAGIDANGNEWMGGIVFRARSDIFNVINDREVKDLLKELGVVKYE